MKRLPIHKKLVLVLFGLFVLVLFFFPKQSSSIPTQFAQLREAHPNTKDCLCFGFEVKDKLTSYTTEYSCFGIVIQCTETNPLLVD